MGLSCGEETRLISLVPNSSSKTFMENATETYHRSLIGDEGQAAVEYLTTRRLSRGSVQSFRLGYVANPLPGHEKFAGRLCIPYQTRSGVVSLKFRAIPPTADPKYLFAPGDSPRLFNTPALDHHQPFVCITEGEIDCITATQAGLPAVGVPGVDGWKPFWARCFQGYDAVFVLCDNDDKGQGARFGERVAEQVPGSRVVMMPEGHDVNSFVMAEGFSALIDKIGMRL